MRTGQQIFIEIQKTARAQGTQAGKAPATAELVTRHGLESFLARLTATVHAPNFVLKGGLLIAAYAARRPTKDIDSEVDGVTLDEDYLRRVVADVVAVKAEDGLDFDLDRLSISSIREDNDYPGVRVRLPAKLGSQSVLIAWDISTGDPVVPTPQVIEVPRVIGDPIAVRGYAPETVVAEKGVTILQRGTTSTRWRDYVDIVQLDRSCDLDHDRLVESCRAVAAARGVDLEPIAEVVQGYGSLMQRKWAAWRTKAGVQDLCEEDLDEQMRLVAAVLDPVFSAPVRRLDDEADRATSIPRLTPAEARRITARFAGGHTPEIRDALLALERAAEQAEQGQA